MNVGDPKVIHGVCSQLYLNSIESFETTTLSQHSQLISYFDCRVQQGFILNFASFVLCLQTVTLSSRSQFRLVNKVVFLTQIRFWKLNQVYVSRNSVRCKHQFELFNRYVKLATPYKEVASKMFCQAQLLHDECFSVNLGKQNLKR